MYKIYEVKLGDTLDSIANKFNTTVYELKNINNNIDINPGMLMVVPNYNNDDYFDVYIIKSGDTLYSIASRYNILLNDLVKINGLDKDNYIYPGQELLIPKKDVSYLITNSDDTIDLVSNKLGIDKNDLLLQNKFVYLVPNQLIVYKK